MSLDKYAHLIKKYRPVGDTLLIVTECEADKKVGSIIIAKVTENHRLDVAKESGIVINIAPTAFYSHYEKQLIEVGDQVLFARYAGKELHGEHDEDGNPVILRWIYSDDVYGVVEGDVPDQQHIVPESAKRFEIDMAAENAEMQDRINFAMSKGNKGLQHEKRKFSVRMGDK